MTIEASCEKFRKAISILAEEKGRIKDRLLVAYASQLSGIDHKHDLPARLIPEFDEVKNALSDAEMPYGYGEYAAEKLPGMSEDEASDLARRIFAIFLELREWESQRTPTPA